MKKLSTSLMLFSALFLLMTLVSSCEKDEGKLPNISFKNTAGYVYADKVVGLNDTLKVGIDASKAEDKDVLKTFNESVSYDGGTNTSVLNETLTGTQGDSYSKDITIITRNQAGTEKYTFTVTNRDGITNNVTLTLTVQ